MPKTLIMSLTVLTATLYSMSNNFVLTTMISLEAMAMTMAITTATMNKNNEMVVMMVMIMTVSESVMGLAILASTNRKGGIESMKITNMMW